VLRSNWRAGLAVGVVLAVAAAVATPVAGAAFLQADDPGPPDDAGPPDDPGPPDDAGPPDDDDDEGGGDDEDDDDDEEENDGDEDDGGGDGGDDEDDESDDTDDESDDETPTTVATHPEAPSVGVVGVSAREDSVRAGEPARIDATLVNRAESDRTVSVRLRLFGEVANQAETTIPAGETRTVTFTHEVVQPGTYEPSVYGASDEFVVEPADTGDPERDGDEPTDDSLPGLGAVGAIAALLVVSIRRRSAS